MTTLTASSHGRTSVQPRVLCVDDSAIQLRILSQFLTKHGYLPRCVESGRRALSLLLENPAAFDVLITDFNMPEMDGATLVRIAVGNHAVSRIIFLTASEELPSHPGVDGYFCVISKPFKPHQILTAIEESLVVVPRHPIRSTAFKNLTPGH